jgi:proteasome lid subunit RPN8/RPN11
VADETAQRVKIFPESEHCAGQVPFETLFRDLAARAGQQSGLGGLTLYRSEGEGERDRVCGVVFPQSVYQKVVAHLSDDITREHGGFLLGFENPVDTPDGPAVVVTDAVAARHTEGSPVSLTFTAETWRDLDHQIGEKYGDPGRVPQRIGWYHSHPNISIFLSHWDLDVCKTYDRRRYPVALVVDPINNRGGFFIGSRDGYRAHSPQGFYEQRDVQAEPMVTWVNMVRVDPEAAKAEPEAAPPPEREPEPEKEPESERVEISETTQKHPWTLRLTGAAIGVALLLIAGAMAGLFIKQQRFESTLQALDARLGSLENAHLSQGAAADAEGDSGVAGMATAASPVSGVRLNLSEVSLTAGQSQRFVATVIGSHAAQEAGVTWSVEPSGLGKVRNGLYFAPRAVQTRTKVSVVATSRADPGKFDKATVTLEPVHAPSSGSRGAIPSADAGQQSAGDAKNTASTPGSEPASTAPAPREPPSGSGGSGSPESAKPVPVPAPPTIGPARANVETKKRHIATVRPDSMTGGSDTGPGNRFHQCLVS